MKKRSIQAAGVEFRERIEAVHVTEVEQPDLVAVVQDISWTEVPFEEAGQQKLNQLIEELPQAPLIPDRYGLALNPRRQQNTSPVARILRIDNGRKTPRPPGGPLSDAKWRRRWTSFRKELWPSTVWTRLCARARFSVQSRFPTRSRSTRAVSPASKACTTNCSEPSISESAFTDSPDPSVLPTSISAPPAANASCAACLSRSLFMQLPAGWNGAEDNSVFF